MKLKKQSSIDELGQLCIWLHHIFKETLEKLKSFSTYSEAELVKNILEKEGIHSVIQKGDLAAGTDFSGYAGNAELYVSEKNFEKAKEILG